MRAPGDPVGDCANCHLPSRPAVSLAPLFPLKAVVLAVDFDGSVADAARGPWTDALRRGLEDRGVRAVPAGTPGAPAVSVSVSLEAGEGRTDAGTRFRAARGAARIASMRVRHDLRGAHAVSRDAGEAVDEALESLRRRVVQALTL